MSRLIEKLERSIAQDTAPIGFATSTQKSSVPQLLIIAEVLFDGNLSAFPSLAADAVLFSLDNLSDAIDPLKKLTGKADIALWGVACENIGSDDLAALEGIGCDFVVLSTSSASSALSYRKERPGRIIRIEAAMDDRLLSVMNMFDIGAVIVDKAAAQPADIVIEDAMKYRLISNVIEAPVIVSLGGSIATDTAETLRDIGVNGIVLPWKTPKDGENIDRMRRAIDSLPAASKKTKGKNKGQAKLPHTMAHFGELEYE